jgi:hypothetical protein
MLSPLFSVILAEALRDNTLVSTSRFSPSCSVSFEENEESVGAAGHTSSGNTDCISPRFNGETRTVVEGIDYIYGTVPPVAVEFPAD